MCGERERLWDDIHDCDMKKIDKAHLGIVGVGVWRWGVIIGIFQRDRGIIIGVFHGKSARNLSRLANGLWQRIGHIEWRLRLEFGGKWTFSG